MAHKSYIQTGSNAAGAAADRHPRFDPSPHPIPFQHTVTLDTGDFDVNDSVTVFEFPTYSGEVYLDKRSLIVEFDDLDSNGTPTLTFDVGLADADDGTIDTEIINDSAAAQTGTTDACDTLASRFLDVSSEKYLTLVATTGAATAAAGDVTVTGFYVVNLDATTAT